MLSFFEGKAVSTGPRINWPWIKELVDGIQKMGERAKGTRDEGWVNVLAKIRTPQNASHFFFHLSTIHAIIGGDVLNLINAHNQN